jgi:CIC family chloride channel protein
MRAAHALRDFSTDTRQLAVLSAFSLAIGIVAAFLAKLLLLLIGVVTNVAYFGALSGALVPPDPRHFGPIAILIPVIGGLVVGVIARFGTEKIRGHGIPEALQSILENGSIIQARVAFWKPLASAIAIGTGGPFGAEGPIIMSGAAIGSLVSQYFRLSSLERRTLLVAGAAAGMSATFDAPIASVLIAVELLLFEWRPRSFLPIAVASFVAAVVRSFIIGASPPFVAAGVVPATTAMLPWALGLGLCCGLLSMIATKLLYVTEDLYAKLPLHWMWWPAIGGAAVGLGGWFVPAALGVGYTTISAMINGHVLVSAVLGILAVKSVIWVFSLASGTSGGVLAPLLMIGAALGSVFALIAPGHAAGAWAIIGMAALVGGTMRAPFMGTLFALETTHAWPLAPAIFVACMAATAFTVLFVPRSILTEKLARRGMHVAREYSVHPFELVVVRSLMHPVSESAPRPAHYVYARSPMRLAVDVMARHGVTVLAVLDDDGAYVGDICADDLLPAWREGFRAEHVRRRIRRFRIATSRRSKKAL